MVKARSAPTRYREVVLTAILPGCRFVRLVDTTHPPYYRPQRGTLRCHHRRRRIVGDWCGLPFEDAIPA